MVLKAGTIFWLGLWLLFATFLVLNVQELFWDNLFVGFCIATMGFLMIRNKNLSIAVTYSARVCQWLFRPPGWSPEGGPLPLK